MKNHEKKDYDEIIDFFEAILDKSNAAIHSEEFLCPLGLKAAIMKGWVSVVKDQGRVVGAVRFYPRKTESVVSLYQFAIGEKYRGRGLLIQMLRSTGYKKFESICPKNIRFNKYYKKTGWKLVRKNDINNYWILDLE